MNERKKEKVERTVVKESEADKLKDTQWFSIDIISNSCPFECGDKKKYFCKFFFPSFSLFVNEENVPVIHHKKAWCFTNHFYDLYILFQRDEIKQRDKIMEWMSKEM